jgi:hypothetical protein
VVIAALQAAVDENRLRRTATTQGLRLLKSRSRDHANRGYGTYMLIDSNTRGIVASGLPDGYGLDLHDVAKELGMRARDEGPGPTCHESAASASVS